MLQGRIPRRALDTQAWALAWADDVLEKTDTKFMSPAAQEARLDMLTTAWVDKMPVDAYALYEAQCTTNVNHRREASNFRANPLLNRLNSDKPPDPASYCPDQHKPRTPEAYSLLSPIDRLVSELYRDGAWGAKVRLVVAPVLKVLVHETLSY